MKKRIMSIVFVLCMVLTLMPTTVFAANGDATALQSLLSGGGTVTLSGDYTIDTTLNVTNTVTLDLNGYTISMTGSGSVIQVESGGNLTLQDSSAAKTGVITGGNASQGGGVYINGGSFTLNGGTIQNCSTTSGGGGVLVAWGTFTMNSGTIQGCSASGNGGGVLISSGGSMTLNGGAIQGCSATKGGGVCVGNGSFTMTGGAIANCTAMISDATYGGGGVYNGSSFTMSGGVIENCSAASSSGGGVFSNADFSMSGGAIIRGCSAKYGGGVHLNSNQTMTMTGGAIEACTATADEESDAVNINFNASLLANGGTIKGTVTAASNGAIKNTSADGCTVFYDAVANYGTISGGIYYGGIVSQYGGTVSGTYYTVSFDLNGGSGTAPTTQWFVNISTAKALKPADPTNDAYNTFVGWYNGDTAYDFTQPVEQNITLTAKYGDPLTYNISYDLGGGTASNPATYTVESDAITLNAPTRPGYTFTGWSGTGLTGQSNMTVTIAQGSTGDRAYTAHYTEKSEYTVVFNANGGSEVPSKTNVKWTDKVLDGVAAPTKANYEFVGWKCGSVAVTDSTEYGDLVADDSTASVTLVAQWENDTTILQRLLSGGGTVQLTRDYTIISTLNVTNTVTLDLNGYTISMTGSGSVIKVGRGGNLTVKDSRPTATHTDASLPAGGVITGGNATLGGGVYINGGSFTVNGGTIANCSASNGGGVLVAYGSMTMNGGAIANCSTSGDGGGVAISTSGSMTMNGGAIHGCSATRGGGVSVASGSFTMTGGTIANCSATISGSTSGGGGVYNGSSYTMSGGVIENCSAASGSGGGVFSSQDFSMSGGAIIRGCSAKVGGGVHLASNRTMTMTGGTIEACTSTNGKSDAVNMYSSTSLLANGGTIKGTVATTSSSTVQNTSASGCTAFYDAVTNHGTISGGIYYGGIQGSGTVTGTYYTVTFDLNGGSGSAPTQWFFKTSTNTSTATALQPADPTNDAYNTFVGWYNGDTAYDFTQPVEQNITLTAKYGDPLTYNISYDLDGGTATNPATYTVESDAITLNNPTKPGYTFTGWSGTGLTGQSNMTVTIAQGSTGDRAYTAHWSDATVPVISGIENGKTYCAPQTVTVSDNDSIASVTVNGDPVTLDANGQFTLNPAAGTQTIVATDNARNETTVTVTVNAGHTDESPKDHICDICGADVGVHQDTNLDHNCDYGCSVAIGEHKDVNKDHACDYGCSVAIGEHKDVNKDHACDYGCSVAIGEHKDVNKDHACDYGCSVAIGEHKDVNKDHACDYGCSVAIGEHKDENNDHVCDYGCSVAIGEHKDVNKDHACDYGCSVAIGEHKDDNKDHACDYGCSEKIGKHKDASKDHYCDYCNGEMSAHSGGTATCTHKAVCEYCGGRYGEVDSTNHTLEHIPAKAATVTETGNEECWHCKDCGKYFSDENGENEIELDDTVIGKLPPEIIEGKGQSLTAGEKKALTFRSNAAFSDFIRVELDGSTLDEKNYTVKEGSTIVTLKADFVGTLSAGEHTIGIVSESGTASTTFTIHAKAANNNDSPLTGDTGHTALWIIILLVSGGLLSVTGVYVRKKKHSEK